MVRSKGVAVKGRKNVVGILPLHQRIEQARQEAANALKPGEKWIGRLPLGTVAGIEIRYYRSTTALLIPKVRFQKAVKDVMRKVSEEKYKEWESGAKHVDGWEPPTMYRLEAQGLLALQEATETLITAMMEDTGGFGCHSPNSPLSGQTG